MNIIMLGPPGAGKGTQGRKIVEHFDLKYLSTGDILRRIRYEDSEIGRRVAAAIDNGKFAPDDLVASIVDGELASCSQFLIDGYPRSVEQAHIFDELCEKNNKWIDIVFYLDIADEFIVDRLSGRRICPSCSKTYHTDIGNSEICQDDGAQLACRPDDRKEVILERLNIFHAQTKPLKEFYKQKGLLLEVDASRDVEEVFGEIFTKVNCNNDKK